MHNLLWSCDFFIFIKQKQLKLSDCRMFECASRNCFHAYLENMAGRHWILAWGTLLSCGISKRIWLKIHASIYISDDTLINFLYSNVNILFFDWNTASNFCINLPNMCKCMHFWKILRLEFSIKTFWSLHVELRQSWDYHHLMYYHYKSDKIRILNKWQVLSITLFMPIYFEEI